MKKAPQQLSNENSTQRILKPKHLQLQQQQKQQKKKYSVGGSTIRQGNKIMLTDLCPEQKAKIGELIKTLQQRKQQTIELTEQLTAYKINCIELEKQNTQLSQQLKGKQQKILMLQQHILKLTKQLEESQKQVLAKEVEVQQGKIMIEKLQQLEKYNMRVNISQAVNTQCVLMVSQYVQTVVEKTKKDKKDRSRSKRKAKQIQLQQSDVHSGYDSNNIINGNNSYNKRAKNNQQTNTGQQGYNSRSFDKIMKAKLIEQKQGERNNTITRNRVDKKNKGGKLVSDYGSDQSQDGQDVNYNSSHDRKNKVNRGLKQQSLYQKRFDTNNNVERKQESEARGLSQFVTLNPDERLGSIPKSVSSSNRNPIEVQDTENEDDQFEMLARKWMELKEKNIKQLTKGWIDNDGNHKEMSMNKGKRNNQEQQRQQYYESQQKDSMTGSIKKGQVNSNNTNSDRIKNDRYTKRGFATSGNENRNSEEKVLELQSKIRAEKGAMGIGNKKGVGEQQQQVQIDEEELNVRLKSGDFSAFKFVNSHHGNSLTKSNMSNNNNNINTSSFNNDKSNNTYKTNNNNRTFYGGVNNTNLGHKHNITNSSKTNLNHIQRVNQHSNLSVRPFKQSKMRNVEHFYNSDLLDLVDQINN